MLGDECHHLHAFRTASRGPNPCRSGNASAEIRSLVRVAINKLAAKYQAVIRLRDLTDLSLFETANLLHLSVPAVKSREHRARRQMQMLVSGLDQLHSVVPRREHSDGAARST
ncbi:MAG: sigma factor-like helix-turn-helix DNA-binding protein [Bryobacteraceae bacterium]